MNVKIWSRFFVMCVIHFQPLIFILCSYAAYGQNQTCINKCVKNGILCKFINKKNHSWLNVYQQHTHENKCVHALWLLKGICSGFDLTLIF